MNGLLLKVKVQPADVSDSQGGQLLLAGLGTQYPRITHLWTDGGYLRLFIDWVKVTLGWTVQVVKRAQKREGVIDDLAHLLMTPWGDDSLAGEV